MYSQDSRLQDAGLIRSQDFNTVFMGTSLAIHFRQSEIDRTLGVKSLKLAMNGSSSREQTFVLAAALDAIPGGCCGRSTTGSSTTCRTIDLRYAHLPADLYRRNVSGIAGYLLKGAWPASRPGLWPRSLPPLEPIVAPVDNRLSIQISRFTSTTSMPCSRFRRRGGLQCTEGDRRLRYLSPIRFAANIWLTILRLRVMVRVFEHDAIGLISTHPDVTFDIYLPPYSILQWVAMRDASPGTLEARLRFFRLFLPAAGGNLRMSASMISAA